MSLRRAAMVSIPNRNYMAPRQFRAVGVAERLLVCVSQALSLRSSAYHTPVIRGTHAEWFAVNVNLTSKPE